MNQSPKPYKLNLSYSYKSNLLKITKIHSQDKNQPSSCIYQFSKNTTKELKTSFSYFDKVAQQIKKPKCLLTHKVTPFYT